ncbi:hypothetical protein N7461_005574 [Penicillium sp. DV-2018c]|nr:hypothetical protein N7461_005574 [Penicillium sp. DV-2018c]
MTRSRKSRGIDTYRQLPETYIFLSRRPSYGTNATAIYTSLLRSTYDAFKQYTMQYGITPGSLIKEIHIVQGADMELNEYYLKRIREFAREASNTGRRICLVVVGWDGFTTHIGSFERLFNVVFSPAECVRLLVCDGGQFYPINIGMVIDYLCGMPMPLSRADPTTKFAAQFLVALEPKDEFIETVSEGELEQAADTLP